MRYYHIKATDFRRLAEEVLGSPETVRLEWIEEDRGWEVDWYCEGFAMWLEKVKVEGVSETGVPYRRLVWERGSECLYMDEFFLGPLAEKLKLEKGELRMVCAQKGATGPNGWPTSDEVAMGYENPRPPIV
ncbi:MAG: hypothetical protein ISS72_10775 [Candidatus Brocadiae bacterium]|nr:hypothetical protein [Candidatus Brocadiia bacterium]